MNQTWENGKKPSFRPDFGPLFFFYLVFFRNHSLITELQKKGEGISLTPHYHFHLLQSHLDISWVITGESSPLHMASSWTWTRNLWFPVKFGPKKLFSWILLVLDVRHSYKLPLYAISRKTNEPKLRKWQKTYFMALAHLTQIWAANFFFFF